MSTTLADLQRRNVERMETASPSVLTEVRTYGSADASKDLSADASKDLSADASKDLSADASKDLSADAPPPIRKATRKEVRPEAGTDSFLEAVSAAIASREPLVGGVKATVDMSPDLSKRAKRYLADHRGQSTRQLLLALFDAFLSAKGY